MKIINQIKAGAKLAPAYLVVLYYIFFILDIVTTYLATPDLKYEGNWLVRYLNFNWGQFILFYFAIVLVVTFGLLVALSHVNRFYSSIVSTPREFIANSKLLLSFIFIGCFYSHVINLGFIVINNLISYIFLFHKSSCIFNFSNWYVFNQKYFLIYIQTIPIVIGYFIAYQKVRRVKMQLN